MKTGIGKLYRVKSNTNRTKLSKEDILLMWGREDICFEGRKVGIRYLFLDKNGKHVYFSNFECHVLERVE